LRLYRHQHLIHVPSRPGKPGRPDDRTSLLSADAHYPDWNDHEHGP
jgi:hypothetical protein